MRLLVITQKVDKNDPVLGFFHRWVEEFSKQFVGVTVICLGKGESSLPANVRVLSLGKEEGVSKLEYLRRFYRYVCVYKGEYDLVLVHMNQEYVLLGGLLWRLWGKRVYLWRNHPKGNLLTCLAAVFSTKVFYTSSQSFTARFKKAVQMPVGIDTNFFKPDSSVERIQGTVLVLGRISPIKKVLECIDWIKSRDLNGTIAGPVLSIDKFYGDKVLNALNDKIKYVGPYTREQELRLCQTHEIYINKTPAGSLDKTILEALACGMKLVVDNPDAQNLRLEDHSLSKLMEKLTKEMR